MPFFDHYPYTNFHNVNLDWVLQAVKSWGALVEQNNQNFINLAAANEAFKTYINEHIAEYEQFVTGYLENLDVQEEINHKLDDMLQRGELTPYMEPYIATNVSEWLEDNITPTTPAVDASLTVAGAAADAKATGDYVFNLDGILNGNLDFINLSPNLQATLEPLGIRNKPLQAEDCYTFDATNVDYVPFNQDTANITILNGDVDRKVDGGKSSTVFFKEGLVSFEWSINQNAYDLLRPVISKPYYYSNYNGYAVNVLNIRNTGIIEYGRVNLSTNAYQSRGGYSWQASPNVKRANMTINESAFVIVFTHTDDTSTTITIPFGRVDVGTNIPTRFGFSCYNQFSGTVITRGAGITNKTEFITEQEAAGSVLFGKTYDAWGDSITAGDEAYPHVIATETGCIETIHAYPNNKVGAIKNAFNSYSGSLGEYITIFCGVNDYLHNTDLITFRSDVESFIDAVIARAPSSKIGWVVTPQTDTAPDSGQENTLEDYVNIIIETCESRSLQYLDLYHKGGWYGTVQAFKSIYFTSGSLHPNATGQALLAHKIKTFLELM